LTENNLDVKIILMSFPGDSPESLLAPKVSPEGSVVFAKYLFDALSFRFQEVISQNKVIPEEELRAWETIVGTLDEDALVEVGISLDGLGLAINSQLDRFTRLIPPEATSDS
jgi:hypothetical protein